MPCSNNEPPEDSTRRRLLARIFILPYIAVKILFAFLALALFAIGYGPYAYWITHRWRYRIPKDEIDKYILLCRKIIAYVRGEVSVAEPDRVDAFFSHIIANGFLRHYYILLKKRHHYEPKLANEALQVFKAIAPIIAGNGCELRPFLNELRYSDRERYLSHDMTYFKECRGDIFTPMMEFFVENILTMKPEVLEIMKVTYGETVKTLAQLIHQLDWREDRVDNMLSIVRGIIVVAEDLPNVLVLGMTIHADVLTRWSIFEGDAQAANSAIRAGQRMKTVRLLRQSGNANHAFRKALREYFLLIADAGAALYRHLETPRRLTQNIVALPPTREEMKQAKQIERVESRAASLERENAEIKQELAEVKQKLKDVIRGKRAAMQMASETESNFIDKAVVKSSRGPRTEWIEARDAVTAWLMDQLAELFLVRDKTGESFAKMLKANRKINYIARQAYSKVRDYAHKTKEQREKGFREGTVGDIIDSRGKRLQRGGQAAEGVDETAHFLYLAASDEWWFYRFDDAVSGAPRRYISEQGQWKIKPTELCRRIKNEAEGKRRAS